MSLEDLSCLRYIQNKLGGSIKLRSGAKTYRYRLHNTPSMIQLVNNINGLILHTIRLQQLHKLCNAFHILPLNPIIPEITSHWFAGFFDADGTIMMTANAELIVNVNDKYLNDIIHFKNTFGGSIHYDSGRNGYYSWSISKANLL